MNIISIGFENPFQESGYTNIIKIDNLDDINVFIGKNNSGKTNILRSIYNFLNQGFDRSNISLQLTVRLNLTDFKSISEHYEVKSPLKDKKSENQIHFLFSLLSSYPLSIILSFNKDIPNNRFLFDYYISGDIAISNPQIHILIEDILVKVRKNQDLIRNLLDQILPFKKIILVPSFRSLETSEKKYEGGEIREITNSIAALLDTSFDRIPINAQRSEPFKIPNLALMLSIIKENQMIGAYKDIMNPEFFKNFNDSLKKILPNIHLSINFKLTELTTNGGYNEYGRVMGDWTKLGNGTQQLISLFFLLILPRDCVYIIDEPENGLHPGLQLKLLQFIKDIILTNEKYSKQFFFASHSTSFIDFSGPCSHFICKKDKENFSIDLLEKEQLKIIRNELGLNPSSLLQANGIIWVEGVSGKPYVNMLFQCFGINLEELDVTIIHFGGGDEITSNHYTIDLLEQLNPNFCIIIDSEKNNEDDVLDKGLIDKKAEYEERKHIFWIMEKFRNIEGIIPQEVINEFFDIRDSLTQENLKKPFENLNSYIKRLKNPSVGIIPANSKKYNKTRDAPRICDLILSNDSYIRKIRENTYISDYIKKLAEFIEHWCDNSLINDNPKFLKTEISNDSKFSEIENAIEEVYDFVNIEPEKLDSKFQIRLNPIKLNEDFLKNTLFTFFKDNQPKELLKHALIAGEALSLINETVFEDLSKVYGKKKIRNFQKAFQEHK